MPTREELVQMCEEKIRGSNELIERCKQQLEEVEDQRKGLNKAAIYKEYADKQKQIFEELDSESKVLVEKRKDLESKENKTKWLVSLAFVAVYLIIAAYIVFVIKPEFLLPDVAIYVYATISAVLIFMIPFAIVKSVFNKKILKIAADKKIIKYDQKKLEALEDYQNKIKDFQDALDECDKEKKEIINDIHTFENVISKCNYILEEMDFNCAYEGFILFYGKDKRNYYDLYVDSLLYDTVRGHQIIQIKLTPGLHSFRVKNTSYNIADRSDVVYSYSFNTEQLEVGEFPEAFAYVCEFKTLTRVNGKEFQAITKTQLI